MGFAFTLRFLFPFHAGTADMLVELLRHSTPYEVGVLSSGPHRATLRFHCSEPGDGSILAAAILAVRQCVPTAQFVEAGPDWVTLTDMAGVAGISRQAMRKLMLRYPHSFPPPAHEGDPSLWHLAEVLEWLDAHAYVVDSSLMSVARVAMGLNVRTHLEGQP